MRAAVLVLVALLAAGCGSSPTAPTPAAALANIGNLTVTGCLQSATSNLFNCANYSGVATNSGSGCAANVRGVTTTFDATTRQQTGSSGWSYGTMVRSGEQISYAGGSILVTGPLSGGWFYTTTVTWDNVACH